MMGAVGMHHTVDDVDAQSSEFLLNECPTPCEVLEAAAHMILDFSHILYSLGQIEQDIGPCVLRPKTPYIQSFILIPPETIHQFLRPLLRILFGGYLPLLNRLLQLLSQRRARREYSVELVLRLNQ